MSLDVRKVTLTIFLHNEDPALYGKTFELRDVIQDWLAYIPQTFPQYTRHTIAHSEQVILQMSKLIFRDDDAKKPVVKLSAMEAYILCAAAYLHDAGMVTSDQEKARILESALWREWVGAGGPGAARWREIETFRSASAPLDSTLRNFLADVQTRFLIAEFVRRNHHLRVQGLLSEHQGKLGRFAFDDPVLLRTISDVCAAHGLDQHELDDRDRYPDRRDVRGQQVNVRFLAILLRLGDLLDMSTDRACPLLMNAACPLPPNSLAHWTQFQRLTHFLVSPDRIEVTALCKNQEEHRIIKDWCSWLVKEASNGTILMARSARHSDWHAPKATIDPPEETIKIEPASDAAYIPSNWRFELDPELVFRRLIDDLYAAPLSFVRELIQNALDATRCELYISLLADQVTTPDFPTQVPEDRRSRYLISLSLESIKLKNTLSGEIEERQVLVIDDPGIGMDQHIIEHYLLQVGRSYYTTVEFQKEFRFVPTSRFGLGFLSVFGASDHVTIDTFKPTSTSGPLRLILTGPRNYILLEKGSRKKSGTRIEVRLRESLKPQDLTKAVSEWCRRVEFPIVVEESGGRTVIRAERKELFSYDVPDILNKGARFNVRAFDINKYGLEGELYVFARIDHRGESWDAWAEAYFDYPRKEPRASPPAFPGSLICIQGISIAEQTGGGPCSERVDFRGGEIPVLSLSREKARFDLGRAAEADERITSRWIEILTEHLSNSERAKSVDGWRYRQALAEYFPTADFWASLENTIPTHSAGRLRLFSLREILQVDVIAAIIGAQRMIAFLELAEDRKSMPNPEWDEPIGAIFAEELSAISKVHRQRLFSNRRIDTAYWLPSEHLVLLWKKDDDADIFGGPTYRPSYLAELPDDFAVGFPIHSTSDSAALTSILLNSKNPFVRWLISIKRAAREGTFGISSEMYEKLYDKFHEACASQYQFVDLAAYIEKWRAMTDLHSNLRPPNSQLERKMFVRMPKPKEQVT